MFKAANVGTLDRRLRLILGGALIILPVIMSSFAAANPLVGWGSAFVGIVLIVTSLVRFCPLYRIIGANTCGRET